MVRTPHRCEKSGVRKGTWTPEEDTKLIAHLTRFGHPTNWRQLPRAAGLARCGKSCRLRWMNYLRPDVKRGNYTQEEDDTIVKLHNQFGNRWSMIASHLHGRSDNEIKNRWHSQLKKRFQHTSASNSNNHNALIESTEEDIVNNNHNNNATTNEYPYSNLHNTTSPASSQSDTYDNFSPLSDFFYTPAVDLAAPFGNNSVLAIDNDDHYANFLDNMVHSNIVPIGADYVWTQQDYSSPIYEVQLWGL
ncbi:hypothetical protein HN51_035199 [Arachis hypogaea]|uniref:Uncharacterized protein n=1 Tax=Arachis hypogaea TaxID=3818 RepID=A0A445A5F6_ARAHY|nr:transcription factor MYB63-like [Arachis ipaensis]XP_025641076.1 transcription factor MYB30-like [Arachis hypogaea]QHO00193.1 Myb-related protein [Arachis hypogaea]RYR21667.1 hypothetical protein Ahy_B03g066982 [Arachis hypogaea]